MAEHETGVGGCCAEEDDEENAAGVGVSVISGDMGQGKDDERSVRDGEKERSKVVGPGKSKQKCEWARDVEKGMGNGSGI